MIPLPADEWLEDDPLISKIDPEDDEIFKISPSQLRRRVLPGSSTTKAPASSSSSSSKLTGDNLAKLGGIQKATAADEDEVATEAGEYGEIRKLGGFEQFFSTFTPLGLGLIYYVVDMEGPADANLLKEAMRIQVKRHPNLRSRIINNDSLESIPFEECPEIKVPYVESEDVIGYTEKAFKQAQRIKDGRELYLWSLTLHHTPSSNKNQIILFIHHTISDGDSILRLLQALVVGMGTLSLLPPPQRRQILKETECLRQLPSADVQLYPKYNGYYLIYHFRSLFRELWKIMIQPAVPRYFRYTKTPEERRTFIASFTLDAPDFKRLLTACKGNKTSVTGALSAACAQTMQQFIPGERYKMKAEILVNFRSKAADIEGSEEAHQLYAAPMDVMLNAGGTPETNLDFWATARKIKGKIEEFSTKPHYIVDTLDSFYTFGHHPIARPLFKLFGASWKQGRLKAVSVSNMGMTDKIFQQVGPYKLGRMQMGIDELLIGHSVFLAVASHEGCLNFTLSYADPIFSRSMAETFGQGIVRSLIENCEIIPGLPAPTFAVQAPSPSSPPTKPSKGGDESHRPAVAGS